MRKRRAYCRSRCALTYIRTRRDARCRSRSWRPDRPAWQFDDESRTHARLALGPDAASVRLDDLPADVQAEAKAAVVPHGYRPLEAVEDAPGVVGGKANAVIANLEL